MKEAIMCASIMVAIILCFVGIIKLPFKTFKEKYPKWYKAVFCGVSLTLAVGLPFIAQVYILNGSIQSAEFLVLIFTTIAGVFGLYTSYEGLGLKELVKIIVEKIAQLFNNYSDSKLAKIVGNVGIEKLNEINNKLQEEKKKAEQTTEQGTEVKIDEAKQ